MSKDITSQNHESGRRFLYRAFLKDVLICSLGAYGGPETHFGVFTNQLVIKKKHITEDELIELIALCSILPGPTSTQTIVSVGYKIGGLLLAVLSMLVWSLPALLIMTLLSFSYEIFDTTGISRDILRYISPMAVGFIISASIRIGRKVIIDNMTLLIFIFTAVIIYLIRDPWMFPVILIFSGIISIILAKEKDIWNRVIIVPKWRYLIGFFTIAIASMILSVVSGNETIRLFGSFYRFGYLVFGGGQVVVPIMYSELVEINRYMTSDQFLAGYGIVQGIPGPMFSFSAYAGGMAARGSGILNHLLGSAAGGIGIFLPGLLLIFFVYPIWEGLKKIKGIKLSIKGINAAAGGMISIAAVILMLKVGFFVDSLIIVCVTIVLLNIKKIPVPVIVIFVLVAGVFVPV